MEELKTDANIKSNAKAKAVKKANSSSKNKTIAKTTKIKAQVKAKNKASKAKKENTNNIKVKLPADRIIKSLQKESLYINETQLNVKMINDFYKFHKRKIKRGDFYSLLLCGLILIAFAINFLMEGSEFFFGLIANLAINGFLIALAIDLWIYAFKYQKYDKRESKKIYNDDISTFMNYYYFKDEKLVVKNKVGTTESDYDCLEAIYETKNFYYILINIDNGYIMKKDAFTKGDEKDFHNFIKEKMGKNYKKRCHKKNK